MPLMRVLAASRRWRDLFGRPRLERCGLSVERHRAFQDQEAIKQSFLVGSAFSNGRCARPRRVGTLKQIHIVLHVTPPFQ